MGIRVYRFGLLAPTAQAHLVSDQMKLAHRYHNDLIQLQRGLRAAMREAEREHGDVRQLEADVAAKKLAYDNARAEIRKQRASTRTRSETDEQKQLVFELKDVLIAARLKLKEVRSELRESNALTVERDRLTEMANEMKRNMRAHCGLYWGTYLLVEAAVDACAAMPLWRGMEPLDPHFKRWDGEGRIGVQFSPPTAMPIVFTNDTKLQIDKPDAAAWWSPVRGDRRRANRTVMRVRVGSGGAGNREPIFASFPMKMHREIPEGSYVRAATVHRRLIGPREEWSVTLTIETPDGWKAEACGEETISVDLGWRKVDGGIRVAMSSDGQELRVSDRDLGGFAKADSLRSIRDSNFNLARARLLRQLGGEPEPSSSAAETIGAADTSSAAAETSKTRPDTSPPAAGQAHVGDDTVPARPGHSHAKPLPEWFALATRTLPQWRSPARLAALCNRWGASRFPGDEEAYAALVRWQSDDDHLWRWETGQRKKTERRRRDQYRVFAAHLARKCKIAVLEKFDLRKIAQRSDEAENETARRNRHAVAVSELRASIVNAVEARGGRIVHVEAAYSTLTCGKCQTVNQLDLASAIEQRCTGCGAIWDQDANACGVLLQRFERLTDEEKFGTAASPARQKKWAKAKGAIDAKKERIAQGASSSAG